MIVTDTAPATASIVVVFNEEDCWMFFALAEPVLSVIQSIDCLRTKCSSPLLFVASFRRRDSAWFSAKCSTKPHHLFIDDRKQMILKTFESGK